MIIGIKYHHTRKIFFSSHIITRVLISHIKNSFPHLITSCSHCSWGIFRERRCENIFETFKITYKMYLIYLLM